MTGLRYLLGAQFLSAFVDNMILFVAQAVILRDHFPGWYLELVQATFLFSYIILSPWVGRLADRFPKRNVLVLGNLVKCIGVAFLLLGIDPAASYAVVGVGAVIYSPAKYGILPWMAEGSDGLLIKANAQVEGFTILAILAGAPLGGWLADHSILLALIACMALYFFSSLLCVGIPANPGDSRVRMRGAVGAFSRDCAAVLKNGNGRFSLLGTSGFWLSSSVLRMAVFIWLPLAFGIHDETSIGFMIMLSGVGLVLGAAIAPRVVVRERKSRVIVAGATMGALLIFLPWISYLPAALVIQTACGAFGGIYVIPLNAMLQRVGEQSVGTGKVIAIQNFVENSFMFTGMLCFMAASRAEVSVEWIMCANGFALLCFTTVLIRLRNLASDLN